MSQSQMCSDNITTLAKAMIEVQRKLDPVIKDKINTFRGSNYASFGAVIESCRELLLDQGIWLVQYPVEVQSEIPMLGLETKLIHAESGEWQSSLLVIPVAKDDPQAFGSALTYARRYGVCSLVGIVTEDDDGYSASNPQKQAIRPMLQAQPNSGHSHQQDPSIQGAFQQENQQAMDFPELNSLPQLDGLQYQKIQASDQKFYITVSGNTRNKKDILKQNGFRWNAQSKQWWKQAS